MKRKLDRYRIGLALLIFLASILVRADTLPLHRLDPSLRVFIEQALQLPEDGTAIKRLLERGTYEFSWSPTAKSARIELLVKLDRSFRRATFHGTPITASTGSIVGVSATAQQILDMAKDENVIYIEPSRRTSPTLDISLSTINAINAHSSTPAITGAGVIVGAIDTGIDYTHMDFRYDSDGDGLEESTRILAILDQSYGFFGVEYSRQDIETDLANGHDSSEGIVRQKDTDGHGTHVMGIAAGDGSSSPEGFVGVAPEAWIVMVKSTYFTSDILAGIEYIFDLADTLGLPAVVNLSLGGHEGPHDGTSLFEQGMDELVQGTGHVIVVSAGNEGDQAIHTSDTLLGNSSSFRIDPDGWNAEIDMWYPGTSQFTVAITPPSGPAIVAPWGTDSGIVQTTFGVVRLDNASAGANPNNGDHEVFIRLSGLSGSGLWQIMVTDTGGNGGRYDAWIVSGAGAIVNGDSSSTIDEPGNARDVITVGAFNTKAIWPSLSGNQNFLTEYPLGVLASFSSHGPTRDGRTKPEISAPGAWISAALSGDASWQGYLVNPDGVHTMELGTSMAAPHVSGAAALLLSIDPELTAEEVRTLLVDAATRDSFTGAVPNDRWGWGKLNVAAAVANVDQPAPPPVDPPPGDTELPEISLEENPVDTIARFVITLPPGTTSAELRIYSADGARVYDAAVHPSNDRLEWPLITNRAESVASGLYLYVLVSNQGTSAVGKLVVAR
ncbi:S8 family serine peptidase [Candidatus Bipolaricaulota bacterium]